MTHRDALPATRGGLEACVIGLILAYLALYIAPLAVRPLASPDEVRYGEIAREMLHSGDWVSPRFNGVRYFEKPVLGHWINALSLEVFGENAFALRLPTAIAAGLTAVLIFVLMLHFGTPLAAVLASGIYLTTFEVVGAGTFAVLDSFLTLFLTAAVAACYFAHWEGDPRRRRWLLALCGLACGGAFLTKGFVGFAIPAIVVAPFLIAERRWRALWTTPWIPLFAAAIVVLPWAVLIHVREPDFWHYFFWVEHVQRFFGAEPQHEEPRWYFIVYLPVVAFPWIVLALPALAGLRRGNADRSFVKYLVLWAALPFIFFSLSNGKLLTYILPCLAPFAMLLALGLEPYLAAGARLRLTWPAALLGTLFAAGLASLLLAQAGMFGGPVYGSDEWGRCGIVMAMLVGGVAGAVGACRARSPGRQLLLIGCAVLPLCVAVNFALPRRAMSHFASGAFIDGQRPFDSDAILISDASLFGSLSWFLDRDDIYVLSKGEIAYGLSYPEARHRYLDAERLLDLIERNLHRRGVVIFCKDNTEPRFRSLLPGRAKRTQRGEWVLWRIPALPGKTHAGKAQPQTRAPTTHPSRSHAGGNPPGTRSPGEDPPGKGPSGESARRRARG